ncbi:HNH endonuclease [Methylocystis sp. JAN1]|uniref:HNH endonuclease n=1 Tax=Methylocystis sp. JAN1 TaxID=3397211 RepID=UPI003FA27E35
MGLDHYFRHSKAVTSSPRWPALRLAAKRRDGFKCVKCGARGRLECDHIQPVRTHPELAFDLANLQSLCAACHARKTRLEIGLGHENPERDAWRTAVKELSHAKKVNTCSNR